MERAATDNRSALSVASDGAQVGEGLPSIHPIRKEANEIEIPAKLPTVLDLADWKISIAEAPVQASAYSDSAEVAWLRECNDPTYTLEDFGDSGPERLRGLDSKLGTALSTISDQHPWLQARAGQARSGTIRPEQDYDRATDVLPAIPPAQIERRPGHALRHPGSRRSGVAGGLGGPGRQVP